MGVLEDLDALANRPDLDAVARRAEAHRTKGREVYARVVAALPVAVGAATVTGISVDDDGRVTLRGSGGGISWPVAIVNPPLLVPDLGGPISRTFTGPDGRSRQGRYRLDPVQAVRDIIAGLTR